MLRSIEQKWVEVRLWTSLSPHQARADQLLELDARRWEQEIFYKELKLQVYQRDLLGGECPEKAAQQVAAMMIACSQLAEEHLAVAQGNEDEEVRRAGAVRSSTRPSNPAAHAAWTRGPTYATCSPACRA